MDLKPQGDGRMHFQLGPVERWIVTALASAVVLVAWNVYQGSVDRDTASAEQYSALYDKMNQLATQIAVQSGTLQTLTSQLADVPRINRDVAETKVRVERLEQDVRDRARN